MLAVHVNNMLCLTCVFIRICSLKFLYHISLKSLRSRGTHLTLVAVLLYFLLVEVLQVVCFISINHFFV